MREVTTIALPRAPKLTLATAPTQHPPSAGYGEIPMAAVSVRLDDR